jgi:hypothetical protein
MIVSGDVAEGGVLAPGAALGIGEGAELAGAVVADELIDLAPGTDPVAVADAVVGTAIRQPYPSVVAAAVAWVGGVLHFRQLTTALAALGRDPLAIGDAEFVTDKAGGSAVVRLAHVGSSQMRQEARRLDVATRHAMANAVFTEATVIAADPAEPLIGQIVRPVLRTESAGLWNPLLGVVWCRYSAL